MSLREENQLSTISSTINGVSISEEKTENIKNNKKDLFKVVQFNAFKCIFCLKVLKNRRNLYYHINAKHFQKLLDKDENININFNISNRRKLCFECNKYYVKDKFDRHLKYCNNYIIKKYHFLDNKICELINYVYRRSIFFKNNIGNNTLLPKFDLLDFFKKFFRDKEEKECLSIVDRNIHQKINRKKFVEENDDKWYKHCKFIIKLFFS